MEQCALRFGDCFTLKLLNNPTIVLVRDPRTIKAVFTGNASVLHAGETARILEPLLGRHSLLLLDGTRHLRERRLMLPPFHGARMKTYADVMRHAAQRMTDQWLDGHEVNLQAEFQQLTLDIIMRTVFGIEEAELLHDLGEQLTSVLSFADNAPALIPILPGGKKARRALENQVAKADALLLDEITRRRRTKGGCEGSDVMSMLMSAVDEHGRQLGDDELRDQLMTLLVAGHETTASALGWTIECLLSNQHTLERLRAELQTKPGQPPTEDMFENAYLDAVIRESLRLRPIIPLVARRLQVPMTLHGYELPAGVAVGLSIYLTQRHPKIYERPEEFVPERFLETRPDPYAWLPFGGGVRRCLGQAFAMYEMKIVLATVLTQVGLNLAPGNSAQMARRAITFSPSGGPRVLVERIARAA